MSVGGKRVSWTDVCVGSAASFNPKYIHRIEVRMMLMHGEFRGMTMSEPGKCSPGTARRLRETLNNLFFRSTKPRESNNNLNSVIETDYLNDITDEEQEKLRRRGLYTYTDSLPLTLSDHAYHSVIDEVIEAEQWQGIVSLLREKLRVETAKLHLDLFLPSNLLERISKDIVRMSVNEPCGLRGCSLHINLKHKNSSVVSNIGVVECDWNTVSTFELHLTLLEDKKRWYSLKDLIAPVLPGCLNESHALEVFISPGFKLVKRKLYRPN